MHRKEDLKNALCAMGLSGKETIMVHSSMKSIGLVEDGASVCGNNPECILEKGRNSAGNCCTSP